MTTFAAAQAAQPIYVPQLGESETSIESRLGPAPFSDTDSGRRWYVFPSHWLYLLVRSRVVVGLGITIREPSSRVPVPGRAHCLGCESFAAARGRPHWLNRSSKDYTYVESIEGSDSSLYFVYTSSGAARADSKHCIFTSTRGLSFIRQFSDDRRLAEFGLDRTTCRPNGFAILRRGLDAGAQSLALWPEYGDPALQTTPRAR